MTEIMFYTGIALMSAAALGAAVSFILLRLSGKRLQARLEAEYGKKRR